jgi:uracil-DNA glycosylase family 4
VGFFEATQTVSKGSPVSMIPKCGACGFYNRCESPKIPILGEGRRGVLIIGDEISDEDDAAGKHLSGEAGRVLSRSLALLGVSLERDCWRTSALICNASEPIKTKHVDYCRPNLMKAIQELEPRLIIPLGSLAVLSLLAPLWKGDTGLIDQWAGWKIPLQKWNAWVCPTYHPAFVLNMKDDREGPVARLWFDRHLEAAFNLVGRPWEEVPDYRKQIRVILDPREAAAQIREWVDDGGAMAFDYETNRLRPDDADAEIVCASVCWRGRDTIAFPWAGEAVTAMSEFLRSSVPKVGANNKFEERWTRRILGHGVRNWAWDTMISAHHLDCRNGITSVKFQAFVRLGLEEWSWSVAPFLKATDDKGVNKIHEIDMRTLLVYCGIDSLVEYLIAGQQKKEMLCQ